MINQFFSFIQSRKSLGMVKISCGDSHSYSDAQYSGGSNANPTYEPIKTAINQWKELFPKIDIGVHVGDHMGNQNDPDINDGLSHANQINADNNDYWCHFIMGMGNHDKADPDSPTDPVMRYVDPFGTQPEYSKRPANKIPFTITSHGSFRFQRVILKNTSNYQVIVLGDLNKIRTPGGSVGTAETGGFPAGTLALDALEKALYYTLANPDLNTSWAAHYNLKDTTTNTNDFGGGTNEHKWQENGMPIGSGRTQFIYDEDADVLYDSWKIFRRIFESANAPGNLFLHEGGHTHRKIVDTYEYNPSNTHRMWVSKYGVLFQNIANLSQFHAFPLFGDAKSWVYLCDENSDVVTIRLILHRNDNSISADVGIYAPFDHTVSLPYPFKSRYLRLNPPTPSAPTSYSATVGSAIERSALIEWTAGANATGYLVIRRKDTAPTFTPTENIIPVPGIEYDGDFIAWVGTANSFTDYDLLPGETYYYSIYSIAGGNDNLKYSLINLTGSVTMPTMPSLSMANLENPEIFIEYIDDAGITVDAESRISEILNRGTLGGNFSPTQTRRSPTLTHEGIQANGNSSLRSSFTLNLNGDNEIEVMFVYKASELNRQPGILLDKANNLIVGNLSSTLSQIRTGSGIQSSTPKVNHSYANGWVIDNIFLDSSGVLRHYRNNSQIASYDFGAGQTISDSDTVIDLFTDYLDTFTKCFAGIIKCFALWKDKNVSNRSNVVGYVTTRYEL